MVPTLFEIPLPWGGTLPLASYGAMIFVAFLTCIHLGSRRARLKDWPPELFADLGLYALVSGILGARIFYCVQFIHEFRDAQGILRWWEFPYIWQGGLVFYGGFLTAVPVLILVLRKKRLPVGAAADLLGSLLPLGLTWARLGCFLNGCCFGRPCPPGFPLSLRYPRGSYAWETQNTAGLLPSESSSSLPLYPVQLMESAACFLLFWLLQGYYPRRRRDGEVVLAFGCGYAVIRFLVETIRTEPAYRGLTEAQWISLALVAGCLPAWAWLRYGKTTGASATPARNGSTP